jgi:hypothetical protein
MPDYCLAVSCAYVRWDILIDFISTNFVDSILLCSALLDSPQPEVLFHFSIKALSLLAASSASAIFGARVAPSTSKARRASPSARLKLALWRFAPCFKFTLQYAPVSSSSVSRVPSGCYFWLRIGIRLWIWQQRFTGP